MSLVFQLLQAHQHQCIIDSILSLTVATSLTFVLISFFVAFWNWCWKHGYANNKILIFLQSKIRNTATIAWGWCDVLWRFKIRPASITKIGKIFVTLCIYCPIDCFSYCSSNIFIALCITMWNIGQILCNLQNIIYITTNSFRGVKKNSCNVHDYYISIFSISNILRIRSS